MIKWKNANVIDFIEMANIIIAICLSVDSAMIFFISCSQFADIPAYRAVILDEIISNINLFGWILFIIRIIRNTPAVTKVDECTSAEIGVGAAIAAGNQAENGNCALFDNLAIINSKIVIIWNSSFIFKFQFEFIIVILIDIRIIISPIRFDNRVMEPEAAVVKFW